MPLDLMHDSLSIMPHISHMRRASLKQATACLPVGPITGTAPLTALAPIYYNSGKGGPPVPRPFMGGVQSGFHAMPALGDDFLTLYEPKFKPAGSISVAFDPTKLDVLAPSESFQRHPDGRIADYLKDDGTSILYQNAGNTISIKDTGSTIAVAGSMSAATLDISGHLTSSGSTPGLSGTDAHFLGAAISGTDAAGTVSMTGSTTVNQWQFYTFTTVTFATPFPVGYTPRVVLTGVNAAFMPAISAVSHTSFTISLTVLIGTATTTFSACAINYLVVATH